MYLHIKVGMGKFSITLCLKTSDQSIAGIGVFKDEHWVQFSKVQRSSAHWNWLQGSSGVNFSAQQSPPALSDLSIGWSHHHCQDHSQRYCLMSPQWKGDAILISEKSLCWAKIYSKRPNPQYFTFSLNCIQETLVLALTLQSSLQGAASRRGRRWARPCGAVLGLVEQAGGVASICISSSSGPRV